MLTDAAIKAAKPRAKPYKLADAQGLFLAISPAGGKTFRLKFRFAGVERSLTLGKYPQISLTQARKKAAEAREALALGIDPAEQKQVTKQATIAAKQAEQAKTQNTLEAIAREWFTTKSAWKASHGERLPSPRHTSRPTLRPRLAGHRSNPAR